MHGPDGCVAPWVIAYGLSGLRFPNLRPSPIDIGLRTLFHTSVNQPNQTCGHFRLDQEYVECQGPTFPIPHLSLSLSLPHLCRKVLSPYFISLSSYYRKRDNWEPSSNLHQRVHKKYTLTIKLSPCLLEMRKFRQNRGIVLPRVSSEHINRA